MNPFNKKKKKVNNYGINTEANSLENVENPFMC